MQNKRGPYRGIKLQRKKGRVQIRLNSLNQPIGDDASPLANHIGRLARTGTIAPIDYIDWRHIPKKITDRMLEIVLVWNE